MSESEPNRRVLKLEPPLYAPEADRLGMAVDGAIFPAEQVLDDAWALALNEALRATVEARIALFELHR